MVWCGGVAGGLEPRGNDEDLEAGLLVLAAGEEDAAAKRGPKKNVALISLHRHHGPLLTWDPGRFPWPVPSAPPP